MRAWLCHGATGGKGHHPPYKTPGQSGAGNFPRRGPPRLRKASRRQATGLRSQAHSQQNTACQTCTGPGPEGATRGDHIRTAPLRTSRMARPGAGPKERTKGHPMHARLHARRAAGANAIPLSRANLHRRSNGAGGGGDSLHDKSILLHQAACYHRTRRACRGIGPCRWDHHSLPQRLPA